LWRQLKAENSEWVIIAVYFDDCGLKPFNFLFGQIAIGEYDDYIVHHPLARSRAVQAEFAGSRFAGYEVGFKPLAVVQVAYHDLFVWKHTGAVHDFPVNRDASLIGEVRFRDPGPVYL